MAEIVEFVNRGSASITPAIVEKVLRHLPQWKLEFTQIYEPLFPHLVDQLEFLDRKSTRLNSSHRTNSYAVFCLKKKLGLAMRDMLANDEPYPLTAWSSQFERI